MASHDVPLEPETPQGVLTVDLTVAEHLGWQVCSNTFMPHDGVRSCDKGQIEELMDTSVVLARVGLPSANTRHGLTEPKLRELQLGERVYKVSDGGNGP